RQASSRFTNVDDATHDHADSRAICTIATSVFRGTAFHLAITQALSVSEARFAATADYFADSSQLFERSERSERSEFCDAATRPSTGRESQRSGDRHSRAPPGACLRLCAARPLDTSG